MDEVMAEFVVEFISGDESGEDSRDSSASSSSEEDSCDSIASSTSGEDSDDSSALAICRGESSDSPNSECVREAMIEERSGRDSLDVGIWSTLPDHLLEMVIVRLPFKSFFRASLSLSKTWRLRVQSPSFQREVHRSSSSWESYCPVYMNHKKEMVGYESSSKRWHRLPPHSYLQQNAGWIRRAAAGSLLCWTLPPPIIRKAYGPESGRSIIYNDGDPEHVYVTNPLMRSWKQLLVRPEMRHPRFVHIDLEGCQAYKVILVSLGAVITTAKKVKVSLRVQIFDSTHESWTMEVYICRTLDNLIGSAFVNGVLYVLDGPNYGGNISKLISFDVKQRVWNKISRLQFKLIHEYPGGRHDWRMNPLFKPVGPGPHHHLSGITLIKQALIFVCGSDLMMAMIYHGKKSKKKGTSGYIVSVLKLDVECGSACEVSRAPDDLLGLIVAGHRLSEAVGHGDCIYISCTDNTRADFPMMVYNLGTGLWHQLHFVPNRSQSDIGVMTPYTYRPGWNPLVEV